VAKWLTAHDADASGAAALAAMFKDGGVPAEQWTAQLDAFEEQGQLAMVLQLVAQQAAEDAEGADADTEPEAEPEEAPETEPEAETEAEAKPVENNVLSNPVPAVMIGEAPAAVVAWKNSCPTCACHPPPRGGGAWGEASLIGGMHPSLGGGSPRLLRRGTYSHYD
jgi:hypothetical protein